MISLFASQASADALLETPPRPRMTAARTPAAPKLDGVLDDPVWDLALPDDSLRQRFPDEGAPASERTVLRILYDEGAIYIGARMEDHHPDRIAARLARRDREIESDYILVAFDSRHDHSTAFMFLLNAAGVQRDALLYDDVSWTADWDAVWDGAVHRDTWGWSAELRIPLSALRFSEAPVQEWGMQVERYITRRKESDRWAWTSGDVTAEVSVMGHLEGLHLSPRRTIELRPFAVTKITGTSERGGVVLGAGADGDVDRELGASLGLDAKLGLSSNLVLDATVNPDFGQVEADEVVLNLTQIETQLQEKRPFFLEGADLFVTPLNVFYSRRVGRVIEGTNDVAAIYGALKLTGKLDDQLSVAALAAVTGPEKMDLDGQEITSEPHRVLSVARLRWALRGVTAVGLMTTAALRAGGSAYSARADHDAFTQSLDLVWRSDDTRWGLNAQLLASELGGGTSHADAGGRPCPRPSTTPGCTPLARDDGTPIEPGAVGAGARVSGTYEGRRAVADLAAYALSPQLDVDDLGYLPQVNRVGGKGGLYWRRLEPWGALQNVKLGGNGELVMSASDATPEQLFLQLHGDVLLTSFWSLSAEPWIDLPGAWNRYETSDGLDLEIPSAVGLDLGVESDPRRGLSGTGGVGITRGLSDDQLQADAKLTLRWSSIPELELELEPNIRVASRVHRIWFPAPCTTPTGDACTIESDERSYRFADLDSGSLSVTLRAAYAFSPRLTLQTYAQLFMARGEFTRYYAPVATGRDARVAFDDLMEDASFTGDQDGDGVKDDDFQEAQLNMNVVLRWEYRPGAAILGVYSRAASASPALEGRSPRLRPEGLGRGPTEDVFLVKLTAYWGG